MYSQTIQLIDPLFPLMGSHCDYAYETDEHHLLHCANLRHIRHSLLPQNHTLENCLYENTHTTDEYLEIPQHSIKNLKRLTTLWDQNQKQTNKHLFLHFYSSLIQNIKCKKIYT